MKTGSLQRCFAVVLSLCSTLTVAEETAEIREFELSVIEELGKEMYRVDKYAARATDILFEQDLDLREYPLRGWVVTEDEMGVLVTFVGEYDEGYRGIFDVRPAVNGAGQFEVAERRELTTRESVRFQARQTAISALTDMCTERYNTIVLPDPEGDAWLVYLLASTMEPELVIAGGHVRFTVSADGTTVLRADRLSRSCLEISKQIEGGPEGAATAAIVLSHLVSLTPVEIHVFLSLLHELDIAVGTTDGTVWMVTGDEISRMER